MRPRRPSEPSSSPRPRREFAYQRAEAVEKSIRNRERLVAQGQAKPGQDEDQSDKNELDEEEDFFTGDPQAEPEAPKIEIDKRGNIPGQPPLPKPKQKIGKHPNHPHRSHPKRH